MFRLCIFDDFSGIENDNAVEEAPYEIDIMCNCNQRITTFRQQCEHAPCQRSIDRGRGFVGKNEEWSQCCCGYDAGALEHASAP